MMLLFVICDVFVLLSFVASKYSVVARDGLVYGSYIAILYGRHKGGDFKHRAWFSSPSHCHVVVLAYESVGVLAQVHYGLYGAGLHFHYHAASRHQLIRLGQPASKGLVRDVL